MSHAKLRPGPRRTSCLTCRQRRKKCDLFKPFCEVCLRGGFECLGYPDSDPPSSSSVQGKNPHARAFSCPGPDHPTIPAQVASLGTIDSATPEGYQCPNRTPTNHSLEPSILGVAALYAMFIPASSAHDGHTTIHCLEDFDCSWPQRQIQLTTYRSSQIDEPSSSWCSGEMFGASLGDDCLIRALKNLCDSIPQSIDATQMIGEGHFVQTIHEYRLKRVNNWFMTPPMSIHGPLLSRMRRSKTTIWCIYLGAQLFRAFSQDPFGTTARRYVGWVDKLEQKFSTDSCKNPSPDDISDRLFNQLELAYLKFVTTDSISGYILLQKALPGFLRLVATDADLYMEDPNGHLTVSFTRTISASRHELNRFIMYDTTAAFVLGVPPLVNYGYGDECDSASLLEWIHGIPTVLVETISRVNNWRAGSRADNWKVLEERVLSWQLRLIKADGEDSVLESMARLAVQESWRHVALIYIYMGMCEVSSHDSRVQSSIRQIIQLGELVANLSIEIHMFVHYVVAGIGAQLEKHRSFIYDRLVSFKGTRVWLFNGPQFSQVLDCLWHGAGAAGGPVMWDDYVWARHTVAPI
ncbi:unnamed protein product [Rhizoctonia solani]|uniref:Zn(2)-C6 fungal-type domain-containing protein n=1 Tax=Rhizoctonia solani TaxID=456999 RepID=A0A8H2WD04_9AGAM|nr:unnamed protein product [Rhizoctonia solani]